MEDFGLALLKGMGYTNTVGVGDRAKQVNPHLLEGRPLLLGKNKYEKTK